MVLGFLGNEAGVKEPAKHLFFSLTEDLSMFNGEWFFGALLKSPAISLVLYKFRGRLLTLHQFVRH